ncbi:hypothetical protein T260_17500 [Geobacillus thermopakistaniensis]|uniref:Uncharacterized protein n=1 Tax=Geobacillus thermopakistaniensis (strain MAS1) TaxID=1408282 RepID=A0A7U9J8A1_GEOTM|nr:hypothetical protein GA8_01065 [Geobacillus sp. A8]ESU70759.1 hypothetical protein T260_17500 [Geobacillus sp. MAS1]
MEMGETLQQELLQMGKQRSNGLFCLSVQMIVKQSLVSTNFFLTAAAYIFQQPR